MARERKPNSATTGESPDIQKSRRDRVDGRSARARRQRSARRSEVLKCALEVFAEKGYHASTISDIISRAGIARGTFYIYFESKRAIFEELLESYLQRIGAAIRRISLDPNGPSPREQIQGNVDRVFAVLSANQALNRILLRQAVGLDAEFDRRLSDFYGRLLDRIEAALELGQEMGVVKNEDARVLAACVLGSVKEVTNQYLVDALPGDPAHDLDRTTANRAILNYNLHGLLTEKL